MSASFGCADPPPEVANGVWKGNNISVTITCNSGYVLQGVNTLICVKQNWEEVTQVCIKGMFSKSLKSFGHAVMVPSKYFLVSQK